MNDIPQCAKTTQSYITLYDSFGVDPEYIYFLWEAYSKLKLSILVLNGTRLTCLINIRRILDQTVNF